MAKCLMRRQAATSKGLVRRLREVPLSMLRDERCRAKYQLEGVIRLGILTLASGGNSQREFEARSEQLVDRATSAMLGFGGERIADNTFGTLLPRVDAGQLRDALHAMVKAEHRRGTFGGTLHDRQVVALDGKVLAPVRLRSLVSAARGALRAVNDARSTDASWAPGVDELRRVLKTAGMEYVQLVSPSKGPVYGLIRMHRWTLVSSGAAVGIDERPLDGTANEVGSAVESFDQLISAYGRTGLFNTVTADAGNTSLALAKRIAERNMAYFLCIKTPQGEIFREAKRLLQGRASPDYSVSEDNRGKDIAYRVYTAPLDGDWHGWVHARQLVRIERIVSSRDGTEESRGNRYYVTSLPPEALPGLGAATLSRGHWRCENEGHWTADAIFFEDAHRPPLSRHPKGMLVGSLLRMMAQNLLAILRTLSRTRDGDKPAWRTVRHHILMLLFDTVLDTEEFDAAA